MKRIALISAVVGVIIFSAVGCGQTQQTEEFVKDYDHKLFTIKLCKGWQDSEKDGVVMLRKNDKEGMVIMAADNNTETPEQICANITKAIKEQNPKATISDPSDVTIGELSYKKIVGTDTNPQSGEKISMYVLATTKDKKGVIVQVSNLDGQDEQAMLKTLKIK
jgi:hypothetical protein